MVAETGAVDGSSVAAAALAVASVGAGVASSGRQAMTTKAPTASNADHFASRETRVRLPSKGGALLQFVPFDAEQLGPVTPRLRKTHAVLAC